METKAQERWYAVYCKSRQERVVSSELALKGISGYVADCTRRVQWGTRVRQVRQNLLPGYVLVQARMDPEKYVRILQTPGVVRFVGNHWPRLSWIPDEQVESLRLLLRSREHFKDIPYWSVGERVEVTYGALAGVRGFVAGGTNRKNHVIVSIDLLQRSVAVEVDVSCLRRVEPIGSVTYGVASLHTSAGNMREGTDMIAAGCLC